MASLRERQKTVVLAPSAATLIGESESSQSESFATRTDLVVVLGGDGTILSAARLVETRSVPILGINMGGLGFLTETTADNLYRSLDNVFNDQYYLDTRIRLQTEISGSHEAKSLSTVLNDIVVSKGTRGRMINIQIWIDRKFVTNLRGDGVIFSSPTGSTAYSLSTGGPILNPSLEVLMVTPISPHTLTHRPLLVPGNASLQVKVTTPESVTVTLDGQVGMELHVGDTMTVSTSPYRTHLIRFPDHTFYDVLRNKLKWGDG